jgi:predicted DNA-binding transcriptional regulator YafY
MTKISKLQRWLDIIAYLVGRKWPVPMDELMCALPSYADRWNSEDETQRESARRGFERDKDELRRAGIPIRTLKYYSPDRPEALEGYVIERRDFYLPYLNLVAETTGTQRYSDRHRRDTVEIAEADAPLALEALRRVSSVPGFPLRTEALSAFRKLAFDLDPRAFDTDSPVLFMDPPGSAELAAQLRMLGDALLARKAVTFRYHGIYRGEETSREVSGYGLLFQSGHWYLIGHDATRDDLRVFRVARMADIAVNRSSPARADYEIPADFVLAAYAGRQSWELGEADESPVVARVLFHFPLSLWAERNGYGTLESRATDGSAVRVFELHQVEPFLRWLLSINGEFDITEPPELRSELKRMADAVVRVHGGGA